MEEHNILVFAFSVWKLIGVEYLVNSLAPIPTNKRISHSFPLNCSISGRGKKQGSLCTLKIKIKDFIFHTAIEHMNMYSSLVTIKYNHNKIITRNISNWIVLSKYLSWSKFASKMRFV